MAASRPPPDRDEAFAGLRPPDEDLAVESWRPGEADLADYVVRPSRIVVAGGRLAVPLGWHAGVAYFRSVIHGDFFSRPAPWFRLDEPRPVPRSQPASETVDVRFPGDRTLRASWESETSTALASVPFFGRGTPAKLVAPGCAVGPIGSVDDVSMRVRPDGTTTFLVALRHFRPGDAPPAGVSPDVPEDLIASVVPAPTHLRSATHGDVERLAVSPATSSEPVRGTARLLLRHARGVEVVRGYHQVGVRHAMDLALLRAGLSSTTARRTSSRPRLYLGGTSGRLAVDVVHEAGPAYSWVETTPIRAMSPGAPAEVTHPSGAREVGRVHRVELIRSGGMTLAIRLVIS